MDKEKFWLDDLRVLFSDKKNYLLFFPRKNMTQNEILNSITRFSIYLTIILLLFADWNSYYFYIPVILIILMIIFHKIIQIEQKTEAMTNISDKCYAPNKNNPLMNVLLGDYIDDPQRQKACSHNDPEIKKEVNKHFYDNLFVNVDDLYENRQSQRQFYTMPSTTIPNDQEGFANWLYYMPPEDYCKTNQESCLRNEDVRYKQFNNFDKLV